MQDLYQLRSQTEGDINFISHSWYKALEKTNTLDFDVFKSLQNNLIKNILKRSNSLIVCNPEDTTQIFGYLVKEKYKNLLIIHFAYVKTIYRNCGIAQKLFDESLKDEKSFVYTNKVSKGFENKLKLRGGDYYAELKQGVLNG